MKTGLAETHQKKNLKGIPQYPVSKKTKFLWKKRSSLSLSISKRLLFFPLSLEKANKNVTFFYITIIRPSPVAKKKKKKTITTRMGMEQRTTTIIRQSGISRRLCTDHEVRDHVQLPLYLSLSLSLYIYISKERERFAKWGFYFCLHYFFFCFHEYVLIKWRGEVKCEFWD